MSPHFHKLAVAAGALATVLFPQTAGAAALAATQKCNGFAELCDRSLGNITFVGAHDSFAVESEAWGLTVGLSSDQYVSVTDQLAAGVRMLQGQGHSNDNTGEVELCHTDCFLLDGGTLTNYLKKVVKFLDDNPNEVIIFLWVNSEHGPPLQKWADSYVASGMDKLSYVPKSVPVKQPDWPTLGELIKQGKRAVSFMDTGANTKQVPYLLDEFSMIFETPPDPQDNNFACNLDRPPGAKPDGRMYLVNHNLNEGILNAIAIPDVAAVNTTNSACGKHTLQQAWQNCVPKYNRNPNILLLDFVTTPPKDPFRVANFLNGVGPDPCAGLKPSKSSNAASQAHHGFSWGMSVLLPMFTVWASSLLFGSILVIG